MDFRDLRRTLLYKLHAIEDRRRHHVFFYFHLACKQYRATKLSHGARGQVGSALLGTIAKQLRLQKEELVALVDCPLSTEDYFRLWRERGRKTSL